LSCYRFLLALGFGLLPPIAPAIGQSSDDAPAWRRPRLFEPYSQTAEAITGPIRLAARRYGSGQPMTLRFGNGVRVKLSPVATSSRRWNIAQPNAVTAEVFRLNRDPGPLRIGNRLCGDPATHPARFIAFYQGSDGPTPLLGAAVFGGSEPPQDIDSPDLCGTFNYISR
jgi:hypothetical protein